jgi:hypothetical protein
MRKLIVSNIMSLDGYFEGPGRDVMALPMDGFFDEQNLERLRAADTLLLGAATYTGLKGTPTFDAGSVHPLRLLSTRRQDGSDNLLLRYEVVGRDG